jgi:hypothetical protein
LNNHAPGGNFFSRRWRGETPLRTLLWRDMLAVGTMINLLMSFAALAIAALHLDLRLALAAHFSPLPYNLFLVVALMRSPQRSATVSTVALVWLVLMTVV